MHPFEKGAEMSNISVYTFTISFFFFFFFFSFFIKVLRP